MRKAGTISYTIDLQTSEVVFNYKDNEVRLPIAMGQSARGVILSYVDKVQRGTKRVKTKSSKSHEDHQVMLILIQLNKELGQDRVIKGSTVKILNYLTTVEGVSEDLKNDVNKLTQHLEPKTYAISTENANKLNIAQRKNKRAYNSMFALLEDDINIFKDSRRKMLILIADTYEKHKSKLIIEAPRSVVVEAKPMHDWY